MLTALGWGALAAGSLVLGAGLALVRNWSDRLVGLVLAFGAGALISAVAFELALDGIELGGAAAVGIGFVAGALAFFLLDGLLDRPSGDSGGSGGSGDSPDSDPAKALALGAFLDGVPEQAVLGLGLAAGGGISVSLIMAIFISNLPEAIGSAAKMRAHRRSDATILRLWIVVAVVCTIATLVGYAIGDSVSGELEGGVNGFAAGALLVMLTDSMIPEARKNGGRAAGLAVAVGFALAAGLSQLS
jgi:zinc transporter, ZIP family